MHESLSFASFIMDDRHVFLNSVFIHHIDLFTDSDGAESENSSVPGSSRPASVHSSRSLEGDTKSRSQDMERSSSRAGKESDVIAEAETEKRENSRDREIQDATDSVQKIETKKVKRDKLTASNTSIGEKYSQGSRSSLKSRSSVKSGSSSQGKDGSKERQTENKKFGSKTSVRSASNRGVYQGLKLVSEVK